MPEEDPNDTALSFSKFNLGDASGPDRGISTPCGQQDQSRHFLAGLLAFLLAFSVG
jgi:hypothetical protein